MDSEPLFLSEETILDYHAEQLRLFGGMEGLGDPSGFSSAVSSPQNVFFYQPDATIFDIAAAYAYNLSMSQAFIDGNKRTALQSALAFLRVNGYRVEIDEVNLFDSMMELHHGVNGKIAFSERLRKCSIREGGLTLWIRRIFSR